MPTPPGFADVAIQIVLAGMTRPAYITFGVDPTATDGAAVAASISTAISATLSLESLLDSNCTITAVRVAMGTDGSEDVVTVLPLNKGCTRAGTSLPPNCSLLAHKRTARGGRRGRGRLYIPWAVAEDQTDESGRISGTDLPTYQTKCTNFLGALSTQGVPMVLLHSDSKPGTEHPTVPGPPNTVTSLTCDSLIATQRRRLGR